MGWSFVRATIAIVAVTVTNGCVATETSGPSRALVVSGPPPQRLAEAPSTPPSPDSIWVAGYWHWTGIQYAWIPGHWDRQPSGAVWQAPRYSLANGRHLYEPGSWSSAPLTREMSPCAVPRDVRRVAR
ncbi:MAG: hypothetical protein U0169_20795 [Polyangiaceae bacterium]